jgi:hypothetical protein
VTESERTPDVDVVGRRVRCPDCGEWVGLITFVKATRVLEDTSVQVTMAFDDALFASEFTEHVLAAPAAHPTFVKVDA